MPRDYPYFLGETQEEVARFTQEKDNADPWDEEESREVQAVCRAFAANPASPKPATDDMTGHPSRQNYREYPDDLYPAEMFPDHSGNEQKTNGDISVPREELDERTLVTREQLKHDIKEECRYVLFLTEDDSAHRSHSSPESQWA